MIAYVVSPPETYNYDLLWLELAALPDFAGLGVVHQGEEGEVWNVQFEDETTTTQAHVEAVMAAHDPEQQTPKQYLEAVQASGEQTFTTLPGWALWTAQEAETYIDTNVTDLASAKVVLKAMAKAIVALRNAQWPGLQG